MHLQWMELTRKDGALGYDRLRKVQWAMSGNLKLYAAARLHFSLVDPVSRRAEAYVELIRL